jgi:anaerobic magnesium-protoporphyrin IX monomethyl ester cyclase
LILLLRPSLMGQKQSLGIPLGAMYISSILKQSDFDTKIIDYTVEDSVDIKKIIKKYDPEIVGVSTTYSLQAINAFKIARKIKKINKDILLVTGGNPVTVLPEKFLSVFDVAVRGEGEFSFLKIAKSKKFKAIKGISYKKGRKIIHNKPRKFVFDLDQIPFPDYQSIDLEKYFNPFQRLNFFEYTPKRKISMITSRGCPFNCFFCSIHLHMGRMFRFHSADYVLRHLELVSQNYNIEHVNFDDDNLTFNKKRFEDILDGMKERKIDMTWDTPNGIRLDTLNRKLLRKMKERGLTRLTVAIESGSQEFIDNVIHKNIKLKNALKIAKICKEENIPISAYFIIGMPGETKKDIEKTLDFALMLLKKYNVIPKLSIALPIPGTKMTEICEKNNYFKNGRIETEDFTAEDIDKYYREFGRKLLIPYISKINWLTVIKNINNFPNMAKRVLRPKYNIVEYEQKS